MGGYGAIHLGMTRSEVLSVVWAMSPCCLAAVDDYGFGNQAWQTAFTPDLDAPPVYADFPFSIVRGETILDEEEYDAYLDSLPIRQVDEARDALRSLTGLAMDVGLGDQFLHIPTGTLAFSEKLGEERIPHLLDVYDGDHRQLVAERLEGVVLPWIGEHLATE